MTISRVSQFESGHLLSLATKAVEREREDLAEVDVAVVFAAAAIEGFLNELSSIIKFPPSQADGRLLAIARLLDDAEDGFASPQQKLRLVFFGLSDALPAKGDKTWQNFEALIALRNKVVHSKPRIVVFDHDPSKPPDFITLLVNTGVIRSPEPHAHWRSSLREVAVAEWAVSTARAVFRLVLEAARHTEFRSVLATVLGTRVA